MSLRETVTPPTLADYVVIILSPALIMALVGSLVFFLAEVLYVGNYSDKLRWLLFFFVFGAVLVARISMRADIAARAPLYGLILAGVVWLAMMRYVEYSSPSAKTWSGVINLGLVLVVWWCAHRLTWDCTHVEDDVEVTGEGLLQAAGFEATEQRYGVAEEEEAEAKPLNWWERFQRYREERKKKRTPGVWVVYFSLAALPLYGLGQAFIPAEAEERRQYVFWLMVIYVGSALGLLMTTCFLGLRRYLRQRDLQMPVAMTGVWLTVGGVLIVTLLVFGALLPRPNAEYSLVPREWSEVTQSDDEHRANKRALKDESSGKDKDRAGAKDKKGQKDASRAKDKDAKGQPSKDAKDKGRQGKDSKGKDRDRSKRGKDSQTGGKQDGEQQTQQPESSISQSLEPIAKVIKKIVMVLAILALVVVLILAFLRYLAPFTEWARNLLAALARFWASLFGGSATEASSEEATKEAVVQTPPRPFSDYPNPYLTGLAESMTLRETIAFTFAAVEAWARERGLARPADKTPREFARHLGEKYPALVKDLLQLADLYAHAVYSEGALPKQLEDVLRRFWEHFDAFVAAEQAQAASLESEARPKRRKKKKRSTKGKK